MGQKVNPHGLRVGVINKAKWDRKLILMDLESAL